MCASLFCIPEKKKSKLRRNSFRMSCIFDTFSNPINQGKKGKTLNKHGNEFNNSKILQEPPLRHA